MKWLKRRKPVVQSTTSTAIPRTTLMMPLEQRLMFDGALVVTAADAVHATTDTHAVSADKSTALSNHEPAAIIKPLLEAAPSSTADNHAVVFVDARVQDATQLLQNVTPGTQVVYLRQGEDGLQQMSDYLAAHPDASSVQIIAHGESGDLWLGSTYLSNDNIGTHASQLATIGNEIEAGGDILIYACNTAAGDKGLSFVTSLSSLTGHNVAASSDRTGAGGNWTLEVTTGDINTAPVLSSASEAAYKYDLSTITVTSNADSGAGTLRNAISSAISGDIITFNAGMTITLTTGQLTINKNLTIEGDLNGDFTPDVTIDANYNSRVLNITGGTVTLDGLTIQHGLVSGSGGNAGYAGVKPATQPGQAGASALGAGVYIGAATVTMTHDVITGNRASGGGGGSAGYDGIGYGGGGGGGYSGKGGGQGGATYFYYGGGMRTYSGASASGGVGGKGGVGAHTAAGGNIVGQGGSTTGGAGGHYGTPFGPGGAGGAAGSIGGGGGGMGYGASAGGKGGTAVAGVYIKAGGTVYMASTTLSNNAGAGGGGGGTAYANFSYGGFSFTPNGSGGVGGDGIGAIQVKGTLHYQNSTTTFSSNAAAGGGGGTGGNGLSSPVVAASGTGTTDLINSGGTVDSAWAPVVPASITSATYDVSTGALVVTGANMTTGDTIAVNKLSLSGEGGSSYTLTSANVTASSSTSFTVTLNSTDQANVDLFLNKNGTSSTGGTTYNLSGAANWDSTASASADTTNGITVSNVPAPTITSATYDASTGALVVTGTGLTHLSGATNDIVANKFTFTGEGGTTYTLTNTANVEITSSTAFTLTLSATDEAAINQIINKNGTSSTGATTYNLAAAEDWNAGADAAVVIADTTGNGVTVSNVSVPTITSATYNESTGALVVTGTGLLSASGASNDIVASKLTLTGEGGSTYTLTSSNVDITSGNSFTITLNGADKAALNQILNKNGTSSTSGTTYNLAAAEDWNAGADSAVVIADTTGNGVTVSNVAVPTITSSTYDDSTGTLVVTGTGFLTRSGSNNDIVANKLTLTGEGGATYSLTDTSNVDITSGTSFTLTLSATDKAGIKAIFNKNGTSSTGGTTYNLAAAEDWNAGADAPVVIADLTGNGVTVSNIPVPTITSATYDESTGALVVTGTGLLSLNGATNDIVANKFTLTGEGGSTYTLTDTSNVEITSGTSFTLNLSATDKAGVSSIINKNGTSSTSGTTYNLAAAEDWNAGADAAVVIADTTGNGITISNVPAPTITSATFDESTGTLVVTGTGFLSLSGASNDIVANKFTFTGEGGSTYTLTDTSNVDLTSRTSFTLNLSATDKAGVSSIINKNGTSSTDATTYNLAAAEDWNAGADAAVVIADTTGNGITVSNVPVPTITSATYDKSTGTLVVTGTGFLSLSGASNDIVANKFTLTGEGGSTYTLTDTSNVEITSGTSFTLTLSATDKAGVSSIINKNGTSSTNATTYNLAAAEDWNAGADAAVVIADTTGNGITVSNVPAPTITSATYDESTGALVVTGTGFLSLNGATNDVVANKFTFTGEGGFTYTLTDTANVEITSGTSFTLTLSATDKAAINTILNKNGTSSTDATTYNLAAAEDWNAGADAAVVIADTTGNGITVSNVPAPSVSSIVRTGGASSTVNTSAASIQYTVTFDESVTGVDATDFALTATGTANGSISSVSGSGTTYTVTVDTLTGDGTLRLDLNGSGTGIQNSSSEDITGGYASGSTYTLDHTAPSTPSAPDMTSGSDTGTSSSDDITSNTTPTFTGTAESNSTVTLYDTDGTTVLGTTTADGSGNWSITSSTLYEGNHTLTAKAADAAGNVSSASSGLSATIDTTAPAAVGLSATTIATSNATSTSTIATLSATDSQAITYSFAAGNGTNDADNGSFTISGTSLKVGGSSLAAGTYNIFVAATDTAGNVTDKAFTVSIVDAPSVSSIVRTGGASSTVNTSAASIQYTVTFDESVTGVDTSDFSLTPTGTASGAVSSISGSGTTYTVTVDTLTGDGTLRLDLNGSGTGIQNGSNVDITGGYTTGSTYTLDHTAPSAPSAPDMTSGSDTGTSSSDDITSNTTPTFTGTAESNSTVTLYDTDGTTVLGTTTADGSGNWSITSSALSDGSHTLTAKATDAAGNVSSASSALSATIDTSASIVSSVSVPANGTYKTGDNLDFTVTYNENVIVDTSGGTPGITLALDTGGIIQADYVSGSGTTSLTFRTTVTAGQLDSTGIVVGALNANGGTLKDAAGNDANLTLNSVGSTTNVLVDGIAPSVTSVAVPANGTYVAGQNLDFTVNFDENVVIDTTGGTPRVAITLDTGGTVYADYVSGSSTSAATFRYTVTSGTLDNTGITVGALTLNGGTLKDTAGNDATLTLNSVGSTASVLVEAIPPVITTDAGSASFVAADNATSTPVVIDSGITLVDNGKSTLSSATISLTGNFQSGEDVLAFTNDGSTMGNIAASYSSATGVLTLTSSGGTATVAQWQSALRAVTYTDTAVTPSNATRTISFQADDGLNVSATATRTVTVTDTNQTPILTTSGGTAAFVEGNNVTSTPVAIDNGITLSDLDNTTLSSATVAITGNLHGSEDVLAFTNDGSTMGNIAASYNSGTGVLTLTSSGSTATLAQWQSALRSVTYTDTSDLPNTGARTISFTVNDGTVDSAAATRSISVTSTNDAPVNSAPASQNVSQDATLAFNSGNGNLISISDVDANGGNEQITLTATHGTITLSGTTGLSFLVGSGTGDATMTFQGTLTDINNALNGLTYSPASGYNGAASLQVTSNDLGNAGSGGAQSDTDNINITVNPVNPVVTSVSSTTANGGYKTGDTVDLTVTFDQAVTVDTTGGTPALLLETGTTDHGATYVSGSGTNTLTFAYVIQSGDNSSDLDYQSTNALSLNGATIKNATNDSAILTLPATGGANSIAGQKAIVVDGIDPAITSVAVPANGTYVAGQNLDFTINTSEAVIVDTSGGTPRIAITLDTGGTIDADYVSGSGTTALTFRATIANGEMDTNGITLSSSIDANGGTLRDAVGNDAVLTLNSVASTANVLVDAIAPTVASVDVPASSDYHAGQTLTFTINTSENVSVDTTGGTPRVALDAGGNTVYANYVSGSGSNALTFQYTVQAGDNDADGIAVSALQSNGGALHDAAGNDLNLTLNSIASTTGVLVDTTAPTATSIVRDGSSPSNSASVSYTVTFSEDVSGVDASDFALISSGTASGSVASVTTVDAHTYTVNVNSVSGTGTLEVDLKASGTGITDAAGNAINGGLTGAVYSIDRDAPAVTSVAVPADGTYVAGQHLDFTINTSEAVIVDTTGGTPRIAITLDTGGTIDADYVSGSGTTALTFRATVANGEMDTNGITLSSSIDANGGTLRDAVGNDAALTLNSVASTANVLVDAIAPAVASVDVPAAGHYNVGDILTFTINTSENVVVDTAGGTPQLSISIGGVNHVASYVSGSGSNALVFQYTVLASDNGTGLTISNNLVSNGASLHDVAGNALNIGLNNIGTSTGVVIDNVAPAASSLVRANFSPTNAGTIHYTLHFSEDVTGLSVNDLALVTTSNVDAQIAGITQVNAHTYTITLTGVKGNGSLQVNLASTAGITDLAGNALTAGINGDVYQVITTVPDILPHHAPPHLPVPGYVHEDHDHGIHGIAEDHSSFATPSFTSPSFITELSSLPVVHSIDVSEHHSFDIPLPWRPVNLASGWSMIELRNADGSAVPTWLHYDVITGALQGTPPATFNGTLQIEIVMTDRHGAHVLGTVELHFSASKASHADNAIAPHAKHGIAKASLDTQFARHANRTAPALNGMHTVSPRSTSTSASIASLSSRV